LCSAKHGILYHVHHIVGVYITRCVDMLAVGTQDPGSPERTDSNKIAAGSGGSGAPFAA